MIEGTTRGGLRNIIGGRYDTDASVASLLRTCTGLGEGHVVHQLIALHHGPAGTYLSNLLIQMYGKHRKLEDARAVFEQLENLRNVYTWTLMIAAYVQHEHDHEAFRLFRNMVCQGVQPDKITYLYVIGACSNSPNLHLGMEIHQSVAMCGFLSNEVLRNAIVNMYGKCGRTAHADVLFDAGKDNVVAWNSMIGVYIEQEQHIEVLFLYHKMFQEAIAPDKVTFIGVISACSSLTILAEGKKVHCAIISSGLDFDLILATTLIKFYDKCACLGEAKSVFDRLQLRDIMLWNSLLAASARHENSQEAYELYQKMKDQGVNPNEVTFVTILGACTSIEDLSKGKSIHSDLQKAGFESNVIVGTALMNMYGKCQQLLDARKAFYKLDEQNVVSWTTIIEVHAVHGEEHRALQFYKDMLVDGVLPNAITIVSTINACIRLMDVEQSKEIHASIKCYGLESDVLVGTALVQMYGRFGEVVNARRAFDKIEQHNVISWTMMSTVYIEHGYDMEAIFLYQKMNNYNLKPDKYLLINILEACSQLSLLQQGEEVHARIMDDDLEPDVAVGTALVDMYGKCGDIGKAWGALQKISNHNVLSWTALISAHAHSGNADMAFLLFEQMMGDCIKPDGVTFLSILSGCSHSGLLAEGWFYFTSMCKDHNVIPTLEHQACMIDLIGRAGNLEDAVKFIILMPIIPEVIIWSTFLGACRIHANGNYGKCAASKIMQLDSGLIAPYVLLSNILTTEKEDFGFTLEHPLFEFSGDFIYNYCSR